MTAFVVGWLAIVPNYATPLLLASLGLILCERAGVLNLGAEGLMAVGAMAGAGAVLSGLNPWLGLLVGAAASTVLALVFAVAVVVLLADQTLAGLAVVALGLGLTGVVGRPFAQRNFEGLTQFGEAGFAAPGMSLLAHLDAVVFAAVLAVVLMWWWLGRTLAGLRLRAVGEDPGTADVAGVKVKRVQILAVLVSGALCGLGGAYLSVGSSHVWVESMIGGRGWIAVALVVFARWHPGRALMGAFLFGGADALVPRLQAIGAAIPTFLTMMLPYALTLAVLVIASLRRDRGKVEPESLGVAYLRQDKR